MSSKEVFFDIIEYSHLVKFLDNKNMPLEYIFHYEKFLKCRQDNRLLCGG